VFGGQLPLALDIAFIKLALKAYEGAVVSSTTMRRLIDTPPALKVIHKPLALLELSD
jgi:hypothetical protein